MASFNLIRLLTKPFQSTASNKPKLTSPLAASFAGPLRYVSKADAKRAAKAAAAAQMQTAQPSVSALKLMQNKLGALRHVFGLQGAFAKKIRRTDSVRSAASAKPRAAMELARTPVTLTPSVQTAFTRQSEQVAASFAMSRNGSNLSSNAASIKAAWLASFPILLSKGHSRGSASFDSWDTSDISFELPLIIEETLATMAMPRANASSSIARSQMGFASNTQSAFRLLDQAIDSQISVSRYSSVPATPRGFGSQASSISGSTNNSSKKTLAASNVSISSERDFRVKSEAFSLELAPQSTIDSKTGSAATLVEANAFVLPALTFDKISLLYDVFMAPGSIKRQNTTGGKVLVEGRPYYEFF